MQPDPWCNRAVVTGRFVKMGKMCYSDVSGNKMKSNSGCDGK